MDKKTITLSVVLTELSEIKGKSLLSSTDSCAAGTGAGKYASQLLKASCASYTQRARSACFVPVMQKMEIRSHSRR